MTQLERQIDKHLYEGNGDDKDVKDFASFISTHWIKEVEPFGFEFIEYGYAHLKTTEAGVHCLVFEQDFKYEFTVSKEFDTILTRDDDSQPAANYAIYCGTLWVFIPYIA